MTEDTQLQVTPSHKIDSPVGKSDHAVLRWNYLVSIDDKEPDGDKEEEPRYNYYKGNYAKFRDLLANVNWEDKLKGKDDVNSILDTIITEVNKCKEATIPMSNGQVRDKKQPWINRAALRSLKSILRSILRGKGSPRQNPMYLIKSILKNVTAAPRN